MTDESKFLTKKLEGKELYSEEMNKGYKSWKVVHTDYGGYTENELSIYRYKDGSISMSAGDSENGFVYFCPEQVSFLIKTLNEFGLFG